MAIMQVTDLSKAKQTVVIEAEKAGYVVAYREGCMTVKRLSKHIIPRTLQGVIIFHDGMALDLKVELSIAKCIRSADGIRSVLA